jgi:putative transcriptional regulator
MNLLGWLIELRNNRDLSKEEVADRSGISPQYYGMIENGVRNPSVKVAKDISAIVGFDWTRFFE